MMEGRANIKYIRTSPRKIRVVCDLVRGKNVNEVLSILSGLNKAGASSLEEGVKSAVANIQEKGRQEKKTVDIDGFYLAEVAVDQGPTLKRFRARAMGRAAPIRKKSSHIRIVLREEKWDKK